jgi:hypothetical protein
MAEITARHAEATEEDCKAIFRLLLTMHKEVGRHALDPNKAFAEVYACVSRGAACMIYRGEELIASAGLRKVSPWYSAEELLADQWFYVRKDCREDGRVLKALLAQTQRVANDTGMPVQIKIYDPERPSRTKTASTAEDFFFRPVGKVRTVWPAYQKVA